MPGVRAVIDDLLSQATTLTTRDVAERAGVSRQAAQKQLKLFVDDGSLRVEGRARAAKYYKVEKGPNLWAKLQQLSEALEGIVNPAPLTIPPGLQPQARFARTHTVEVASAGSLFRLSARLLLADVDDCDELTLDFNGVSQLGEEFVEEVFERWASAHPLTKLRIVNLHEALTPRVPATFR